MLTDYQAQRFYEHVANTEMIDMRLKKLEELVQHQNRILTWIAKVMCSEISPGILDRADLKRDLRTITGDELLC